MNSRAFLRARNSLYGKSIARMARLLRPHLGAKVDEGLLRSILKTTFPVVTQTRNMAQDIAYRDYLLFVANQDPIPKLELNRFTEELWSASLVKNTEDMETFTAEAAEQVALSGDYWSRDAEMGQRVDSAKRDPRIWKVARVDPEPPSCPFCTLLNSRGATYLSQESAARTLHTGDECSVVFVRVGQVDYPFSESTAHAKDVYKRAVKAAGPQAGPNQIMAAIKDLQPDHEDGKVRRMAQSAIDSEKQEQIKQIRSKISRIESFTPTFESAKKSRAKHLAAYKDQLASLEGTP